MSITRYIITYSIVALIVGGFIYVMHQASKFDYHFVNKCSEAGGQTENVGDTWRCIKDNHIVIIGE